MKDGGEEEEGERRINKGWREEGGGDGAKREGRRRDRRGTGRDKAMRKEER